MNSNERRIEIVNILKKSDKPIKGLEIAKKLNVSRQVIVQDVAILRASGENIISTSQGYIILKEHKNCKFRKTVVCNHKGYFAIEDELNSIVDMGGKIIDVIVEHPVYGEIKSLLMISSRFEVNEFMDNLKKTNAEPLSALTDGVHLHLIETENEDIFNKIKEVLIKKGYLIK